ncbi:hypothetical protein F5144DRAFT_560067 [Chaetomium tenue]|uniref:Uncharacterized protein n=1 Tax=Chaetomium tenue TaxID=1854479 RepID=A0ACB7PEZ3_9PEZI|nr:hypothetical protein F5144DRAFT_560067 [Chaetomium globosum]
MVISWALVIWTACQTLWYPGWMPSGVASTARVAVFFSAGLFFVFHQIRQAVCHWHCLALGRCGVPVRKLAPRGPPLLGWEIGPLFTLALVQIRKAFTP